MKEEEKEKRILILSNDALGYDIECIAHSQ